MKKRFIEVYGETIDIPPFPVDILNALLGKLRDRQSFCPYCSGEKACDNECILLNLWFKDSNTDASPFLNVDDPGQPQSEDDLERLENRRVLLDKLGITKYSEQ